MPLFSSPFFFLSDKPNRHVPDPCIPTQSQVEEERVCRVQVWVVCWVESGVQLVEVRVAQCAEWLMRVLWLPRLKSGPKGDTPCLASSTLLAYLWIKPGIEQVLPEQWGHNPSLNKLIISHCFCPLLLLSSGAREKDVWCVSLLESCARVSEREGW